MSTALTTLVVMAASAGQYPDTLDNLRAGDVVPQVGLLLDRSCSMGWGAVDTDCPWFATNHNSGSTWLNKTNQMKSVLVGCKAEDDGVIDLWSDRVNFSVYDFGSGTSLRVPFDSTKPQVETGILAIPSTGATHMSRGLENMGEYFNSYFNSSNTLDCRPNFIVMLSDGNPNGGDGTFDWECTPPTENRAVSRNQPWLGSEYMFDNPDLLCGLPGDQNIRTYTIGFGQPGDFSPSNLQNIASFGGGEYFYASDAEQLNVAFENIISAIVARSALFFAPVSIQTDSLFSSNYAYAASFRPEAGGPWRGTIKKYCVVPPVGVGGLYSTTVDTCLFVSPNGTDLETNPQAQDLWTGSRSLSADNGGAGAVVLSQLRGAGGGPPVAPYYAHRNIVSWRPGTAGYVSVDPTTWTREDAKVNGCDHYRLLNRIHGYTYDADCSTGAPQSIEVWPLGDPVHFSPVILKYDACHDSVGNPNAGACFVVAGMNDGKLHVFDAATGAETTALVMGEHWDSTQVVHSRLGEVMEQPNLTHTHRYFVDGMPRLFHEDNDADGVIDSTETALLIFGLGRGGRAYYAINVTEMPGGILDATRNPIFPLPNTPGTAFAQLQDTWSAPWLGRATFGSTTRRTAVFPSGHIGMLDLQAGQGNTPGGSHPYARPAVDAATKLTVACSGAGGFAAFNGLDAATWCESAYFDGCQGDSAAPCYDGGGTPLDRVVGPLTYNNGANEAIALRLHFDRFDLDPDDTLRIEDDQGNLVGEYSEGALNSEWTPWIYGSAVVLRFVTDGVDSLDRGYRIDEVQWAEGPPIGHGPTAGFAPSRNTSFVLGQDHKPTIYMVDVDRWNGATRTAFAQAATDDGILLRITNDCGAQTANCLDQNDYSELAEMICPISAEPSVFTEGGRLKAVYWGDECAQIWKAWTDDGGVTYSVRRLVNLNSGQRAVDKDHRKIFRKLDLVQSSCPGTPVLGVYFGTGDQQRPTAKDELQNTAVTNGRDIVGVIWDHPALPTGLTQTGLLDVTTRQDRTAPQILINEQKHGWYVALNQHERMLRDPLVFDGVAFYKTYEPTQTAPECGGGSGIDRIYAVDNCNGAPTQDVNGNGALAISERPVWNGQTEIGGGLFFFTPKNSPVLVSHADLTQQQSANLNERGRSRPGLFLWREF